jgi:hypothetical protein
MIKDKIGPLTNFVVERMQDSSFAVREAAGETVGRFSEHICLDFLVQHKKIMPCLIKVIHDLAESKHDMTIQKSLFALNEFVANLDFEIKLYLEDVVKLLLAYVQEPKFSRDVKYWALVSLASTIGVAQKKIQPYMNPLLEAFSAIVTSDGAVSEQQSIKG